MLVERHLSAGLCQPVLVVRLHPPAFIERGTTRTIMTILVDANSRGYAFHDSAKLTVGAFQTQAIFGMVKEMRNIYFSMPTRQVYVLWDGRAQWRYDLYPEYKAGREGKSAVEDAHRAAYKAQVAW